MFNFKPLRSNEEFLNRVQDEISKVLNGEEFDITKGRFLKTKSEGVDTTIIPLTTTAKSFEHKLGRKISGFIIAFQDANQTIYGNISSDPSNSLTLQASGNVNAKVWVF